MASIYRHAELSWGDSTISFSSDGGNAETKYVLTDITGWFGGVGVKGTDQAKEGHGDFLSRKRRGPRPVTIEAVIQCEDEETRNGVDRFISGILWDGEPGKLTVTIGEQTLHTDVTLQGEIGHKYVGTTGLSVQIPLRAPDPFLYSEPTTYQLFPSGYGEGLEFDLFDGGVLSYGNSVASSKVIIKNEGNAEAWPVFITRMNFPSGLRIDDGRGNTIELPMFISQSAEVRIDMRGAVLINGVDFSHRLKKRDWFSVAPGESIQPRVTSLQDGDGWVNVELSNTYI